MLLTGPGSLLGAPPHPPPVGLAAPAPVGETELAVISAIVKFCSLIPWTHHDAKQDVRLGKWYVCAQAHAVPYRH